MNDSELIDTIQRAAQNCGFDACGIVGTEEMAGYAEAISARITHFPGSNAMYDRFAAFATPSSTMPWAKAVIICAHWYGNYRVPENLQGVIGKSFCLDTRKDAYSKDYQGIRRFQTILSELGLTYAVKHDYGVTALRWAAAKAGIGVIRKNNFFYTEQGSWHRLEAFLIDRELELKLTPSIKKCPEKCGLCIKACPTKSLDAPFQMNGLTCVSFLTSKGTCAPGKELYDRCGSWIFGCDACQDACPFNKKMWDAGADFPGLEELAGKLSFEQILSMDEDTLCDLLSQKFWYIAPDNMWKWKCNVLNAIHNSYDKKYLPYIEKSRMDARKEVREMAHWVFESVSSFP